jgi:homocysteine S-methyltransferase
MTQQFVTDGGLETDLIFHHGLDLPEFAAFPLVEEERGRALLRDYYDGYAVVAAAAGVGLLLEAPTWRANPDWGARVGYDAADQGIAEVRVGGLVGPRGDGYVAGEDADPDEAADYHATQAASFAAAGADLVTALTLTGPGEAIGFVRAVRAAGLPAAVGFTVETDGRLPDGTTLRDAIARVDAAAAPDYYVVNCAHPTHVAPALDTGGASDAPDDTAWLGRIEGLRPNASRMSHAELDEGDPAELASGVDRLRERLPNLRVVGGCCGTDSRHVAALWGVS